MQNFYTMINFYLPKQLWWAKNKKCASVSKNKSNSRNSTKCKGMVKKLGLSMPIFLFSFFCLPCLVVYRINVSRVPLSCGWSEYIFFHSSKITLFHSFIRKYPIHGHILGVLTHTTAWDQYWEGDETLKWVLIYAAWLCFPQ